MQIDKMALNGAVTRVGDRWSLPVIAALLDGDKTFGELANEVHGIAPNILTSRLRALERDALVVSRPYQHRPVRMRYALTASGRRLGDAVALLSEWGAGRQGESSGPRHEPCGVPLQLRQWCPACEVVVDAAHEAEIVWL